MQLDEFSLRFEPATFDGGGVSIVATDAVGDPQVIMTFLSDGSAIGPVLRGDSFRDFFGPFAGAKNDPLIRLLQRLELD